MSKINNESLLSQEYLKEVLEYNSDTGNFVWKNLKTPNQVRVGDNAGCLNIEGYIIIKINNIRYCAHRLAWLYITGSWPQYEVDHINRIKIDNRIINLRDTPNNSWNKDIYSNNKSNAKGVRLQKNGTYKAEISINGKTKYLGYFKTLEEASIVYQEAKFKYHKIIDTQQNILYNIIQKLTNEEIVDESK